MLSEDDKFNLINLVWSAGFWEGEGSCNVYKAGSSSLRLVVSVCQTDKAPIEKFCTLFSGNMTETIKEGYKTIYRWELNNTSAYLFLTSVRPYVVSKYKQEQIDSTLKKWESYRTKLGKTKHISKRERANDTSYEVRVQTESGTKFIGSFKNPEQAQLALYTEISKKGIDIYDFSK